MMRGRRAGALDAADHPSVEKCLQVIAEFCVEQHGTVIRQPHEHFAPARYQRYMFS